jgi:hypothetical protein
MFRLGFLSRYHQAEKGSREGAPTCPASTLLFYASPVPVEARIRPQAAPWISFFAGALPTPAKPPTGPAFHCHGTPVAKLISWQFIHIQMTKPTAIP